MITITEKIGLSTSFLKRGILFTYINRIESNMLYLLLLIAIPIVVFFIFYKISEWKDGFVGLLLILLFVILLIAGVFKSCINWVKSDHYPARDDYYDTP